jgi:hypothetical protein
MQHPGGEAFTILAQLNGAGTFPTATVNPARHQTFISLAHHLDGKPKSLVPEYARVGGQRIDIYHPGRDSRIRHGSRITRLGPVKANDGSSKLLIWRDACGIALATQRNGPWRQAFSYGRSRALGSSGYLTASIAAVGIV